MASRTFLCLVAILWQTKASSQFVAVKAKKTWTDANKYCVDNYDTTLATIRNEDDAQELFELYKELNQGGKVPTWTGLNDRDKKTHFQWISGFPCDSDQGNCNKWVGFQDNHERCAAIPEWATSGATKLADRVCSNKYYFICDAPITANRMAVLENQVVTIKSDVASIGDKVQSLENIGAESRIRSLENIRAEDRIQSLENVMDGFLSELKDERESLSVPVGLVPNGDYLLFALAISNLVVMVGLCVFCAISKSGNGSYGKVVTYDTERV